MISAPVVVFGSERVESIWPEILPLFRDHWKEVAHYKDIPLNPNFEVYKRMDDGGMVRVYTAREDGKLIGYSVYILSPNHHYMSSVQANEDVIFIRKDRRGFGKSFIKWCDDQLRGDGVQVVTHHVKVAHDFGRMLERIGYEFVDKIYARRLF